MALLKLLLSFCLLINSFKAAKAWNEHEEVNCGLHKAITCSGCPQFENWCGGDCIWIDGVCTDDYVEDCTGFPPNGPSLWGLNMRCSNPEEECIAEVAPNNFTHCYFTNGEDCFCLKLENLETKIVTDQLEIFSYMNIETCVLDERILKRGCDPQASNGILLKHGSSAGSTAALGTTNTNKRYRKNCKVRRNKFGRLVCARILSTSKTVAATIDSLGVELETNN